MPFESLAGRLLLASPTLGDPNFADSVVLLCHHDRESSLGLVINRPRDLTLAEVLADLKFEADTDSGRHQREIAGRSTFEGGPIEPFRGFVLHDGWHIYESTMRVSNDLHLTTSRDVLEEIARGTGPEHFMLILGYAGWSGGQLEEELANNDWLVADPSQQLLFLTAPEHRWALAAQSLGVRREHLSRQIGHA